MTSTSSFGAWGWGWGDDLAHGGWVTPTDIPASEAAALKVLYYATNGDNWTDNTGWGTDPVANNWYGVVVAGDKVTQINLNANNLVGNVAAGFSLVTFTGLTRFYMYLNPSLTGDMSVWTLPASMQHYRVYGTGLSSFSPISAALGIRSYYAYDCALSQATVDAILLETYTNWAAFTYATPVLWIDGTNAAPSGIYQDGDPPTTGKEYAFELENDPEATGNEVWDIKFTA